MELALTILASCRVWGSVTLCRQWSGWNV